MEEKKNNSAGAPEVEQVAKFEEAVRADLIKYLQNEKMLDEIVPDCPDVEEKWPEIAKAYLPDGAREFQQYPVVSLGWMMFMGMAMSFYWDTDWQNNADRTDFYEQLRDKDGYDNFDDTVVKKLLGYDGEAADKVTELVSKCAARVLDILHREQVEPGTEAAFGCYLAALHQLYLAGMAMELNALGYHMSKLNAQDIQSNQ